MFEIKSSEKLSRCWLTTKFRDLLEYDKNPIFRKLYEYLCVYVCVSPQKLCLHNYFYDSSKETHTTCFTFSLIF